MGLAWASYSSVPENGSLKPITRGSWRVGASSGSHLFITGGKPKSFFILSHSVQRWVNFLFFLSRFLSFSFDFSLLHLDLSCNKSLILYFCSIRSLFYLCSSTVSFSPTCLLKNGLYCVRISHISIPQQFSQVRLGWICVLQDLSLRTARRFRFSLQWG